MKTTVIRKHRRGVYRIALKDGYFGQITKTFSMWDAEVRHSDTGVLVRYSGKWGTRAEAVDELLSEDLP